MNFKNVGLGLAATAAMTAGVALAEAPAQALSFGDTLEFSTDDQASPNQATLNSLGGGLFSFNAGALDIDVASEFGAASAAFGDNILTLQQIAAQTGAIASYQLVGASVPWLFNLGDGLGGFTRTYTLTSFILNQETPISAAGFGFTATFDGFFQPPTGGVQGIGGFGGFGRLTSTGSTIAGDITVVPTPALLPGLVGLGLAALRKRKGEAEQSAKAEV